MNIVYLACRFFCKHISLKMADKDFMFSFLFSFLLDVKQDVITGVGSLETIQNLC